jgi:hypothetical protein
VDFILANDPVQIIKLTEIKSIVESPSLVSLDHAVIEDYEQAPNPIQTEISQFLISTSLDNKHPDIVRQNCYIALATLNSYTNRNTILECAQHFVDKRLGRRTPLLGEMRVANSSGILPYLRSAHVNSFYPSYLDRLDSTGYHWENNNKHGELLRDLKEVGGTTFCNDQVIKDKIIEWLILCYIGEPGAYGYHGRNRQVFFTNSGAPLSFELLEEDEKISVTDVNRIVHASTTIRKQIASKYVMRKLQEILYLY